MYLSRRVFLASLVIGTCAILGCSDPGPTGMKNMQLGTGPSEKYEQPRKKGVKKGLDDAPPLPKAPP
jgi:hypothetical protein